MTVMLLKGNNEMYFFWPDVVPLMWNFQIIILRYWDSCTSFRDKCGSFDGLGSVLHLSDVLALAAWTCLRKWHPLSLAEFVVWCYCSWPQIVCTMVFINMLISKWIWVARWHRMGICWKKFNRFLVWNNRDVFFHFEFSESLG